MPFASLSSLLMRRLLRRWRLRVCSLSRRGDASPAVAGSKPRPMPRNPSVTPTHSRAISPRQPVVWDDGAAWDSSREESTPKIMARMPKEVQAEAWRRMQQAAG